MGESKEEKPAELKHSFDIVDTLPHFSIPHW
jgi:hypothetical protein